MDPIFDMSAQIDVLLGNDIFPNIVRSQGGIHIPGYPSALDTLLE